MSTTDIKMENARQTAEPRRCMMKVRPRLGCGTTTVEGPESVEVYQCQTCLNEFVSDDMNHRRSRRHEGVVVRTKNCVDCYRRQVRVRTCIFKMNKLGIDASSAQGAEMMAMAIA